MVMHYINKYYHIKTTTSSDTPTIKKCSNNGVAFESLGKTAYSKIPAGTDAFTSTESTEKLEGSP